MPSTSQLPAIAVSRRGADRLNAGHVWVYRSDIVSATGTLPGALVRVVDDRGKALGTALYSTASQIAIRMLSSDPVNDLPALLRKRIQAAVAYRERFVHDTNAYRVIFSEADLLPGLIVDRYNDLLSLQVVTQAMDTAKSAMSSCRNYLGWAQPRLPSAWTLRFVSWNNCLRAIPG